MVFGFSKEKGRSLLRFYSLLTSTLLSKVCRWGLLLIWPTVHFNTHTPAPDHCDVFEINIHFYISQKAYFKGPAYRQYIENRLLKQISFAEDIFSDAPALKINARFEGIQEIHGKSISILEFQGSAIKANLNYRRFMDNYFDIELASQNQAGTYKILVVDKLLLGNQAPAGKGSFPPSITPFKRQHGAVLVDIHNPSLLAHELGHEFGLKHIWDKYLSISGRDNCNSEYPKGNKGKGSTRRKIGKDRYEVNLMDYQRGRRDRIYLNGCQRQRAAAQRFKYMNTNCSTNYALLKGSE